jgi:hypothetical protein
MKRIAMHYKIGRVLYSNDDGTLTVDTIENLKNDHVSLGYRASAR